MLNKYFEYRKHKTNFKTEVIAGGGQHGQVFDIETLEDIDLMYDVKLSVAQTCRVSISYDIYKLDEIKAGHFMQLLKLYLDDPDLLLL